MNYAKFYESAERMLVEALSSLWFKGKSKEKEYVRKVLTKDEPLLAEPVFQSIFPWEESLETFAEHADKLKILTPQFINALSSESIIEDLRFPKDRRPYKHQTASWQKMLSGENKTIVVTSGTGSGKTECFMIPVLQDIANRAEKNAVQAIFLYPLNALMKSQQKRIHAWCDSLPDKITYAIYNGDTEKEKKSQSFTDKYLPQLITRPQIRQTPPQILFTNPTMLNYMLVRAEDKEILEKSHGKLKWILLDEAHTYTGSAASELALQLRRVLDAFGVTIDQVNFAVTSATIGDEKDPNAELKLKTFVSQLTGKPVENIEIIGGKRVIPEMNPDKAQGAIDAINERFNSNITLKDIEAVRKKLNREPALTTQKLVSGLDKQIAKDRIQSLKLIDALGEKVCGLSMAGGREGALLPSRAHFFIRSISGLYVCVNSACTRHKRNRIDVGNVTSYQNNNCPECGSKMLELVTCQSCGGLIVFGESSTTKGYRMRTSSIDLETSLFYETEDKELNQTEEQGDTSSNDSEVDGYTKFYYGKPKEKCIHPNSNEYLVVFDNKEGKIRGATEEVSWEEAFKSLRHTKHNEALCPHCRAKIRNVDYLRASATQMGRILSSLVLDNAEGINSQSADILYEGKKFITFTDSRQGSARSAMGTNQDVERSWIRSAIFHHLADSRIDSAGPSGLTEEEEQRYQGYLSMGPVLQTIPFFFDEYQKLEAKKRGSATVPVPQPIAWLDLKRNLENSKEYRQLYKHIGATIKQCSSIAYLEGLLLDQFGWIPKRANSLETMGFVRLVYSDLVKAKCPEVLLRKGFNDQDWRDFLKICIDYQIRGGRHYMLSSEYRQYITQQKYTAAIYPSNSPLKEVTKWPKLNISKNGVEETQSRLILLLCAALGYTDIQQFDNEKIAIVNHVMSEAWDFLTTNMLSQTDSQNQGYMLDLLGPKVHLQLFSKGYVCPVDNVFIDTVFRGFSPRIQGYIGAWNFARFTVTGEFDMPFFPFKSNELSDVKIKEWMDTQLSAFAESGLLSNLQERIYLKTPIYLSAEHSGQQSSAVLNRFEREFNEGQLNILSCSTTMEMGVDIGGITEVVMNNVPPKSSNYLQRAGRAGRRGETKAMALTFCGATPIGHHTWNYPTYPITHLTETPMLKFESLPVIQRHINALMFADFVSAQGGFKVTAKVRNFFTRVDGLSLLDQFINHLDGIANDSHSYIEISYERIVRNTIASNRSLVQSVNATKKAIIDVKTVFEAHQDSLDKTIGFLSSNNVSNRALKAMEIQRENLLNNALLPYLAENSFLPSAGIPTGLVQCILDQKDSSDDPTMHLSQAIAAYAPGSKIVKNEWVYEPAGIRMKLKYDTATSRYVLQNCANCGYTTIRYGNPESRCPKCQKSNTMYGIKDFASTIDHRFTEVVEPAAFSVDYGYKATRKMETNRIDYIQPVLLEMDPWQEKQPTEKIAVRCSTPQSEILFYNRGGSGYGYALCPYCGKMQSETESHSDEIRLANHRHLSTGVLCPGGESNGGKIRRHVLLVGRYQTDFVEIKFYNQADNQIEDIETLYSLGVIITHKLTELLGVNDGEIDFGYDSINHSIFVYDTTLGGAGYSILFNDYKDKIWDTAYKTLTSCTCERACTKCLVDRKSQVYLNYLNRQKAIEWIESVMR